MLNLKAGFQKIPFESAFSYNLTFVTHQGKFQCLMMLMGLTQVPDHFQFVVKSVLYGMLGNHPLPVVIYLDDIAIYKHN